MTVLLMEMDVFVGSFANRGCGGEIVRPGGVPEVVRSGSGSQGSKAARLLKPRREQDMGRVKNNPWFYWRLCNLATTAQREELQGRGSSVFCPKFIECPLPVCVLGTENGTGACFCASAELFPPSNESRPWAFQRHMVSIVYHARV